MEWENIVLLTLKYLLQFYIRFDHLSNLQESKIEHPLITNIFEGELKFYFLFFNV